MRIRFGWSTILTAALFLITLKGISQEQAKHIQVPRVERAPRLEDFIKGQKREAELEISDFRQREPQDGAPVSKPTTAYLSYDKHNLYVAFVCKVDPRTLRAHLAKRENVSGDDVVGVSLDTFHDKQRAYEFFANALGVQEDAITAEGMDSDDFSFDTVWRSEGRITQDGYVVLFSIPFRSLRFHSRQQKGWGVALTRSIPGNRELATWPLLTQRIEAFVPQFGDMDSPQDVRSSHNMQFTPYVFAAGEKFLDTSVAPAVNTRQNVYRGGLDAKVVLHDSITLDATVNPDFSQVESDEPQVTTNQRYEVFFPEKRPFFLENSDFFQTPETLLFTRRVLDPQYGLRLTGKVGNWKVGFLGADDRAPGKLVAANDPLRGDRAEIFAGRVQRLFGGSSHVGGMFTRRQFGGSSTTLFSVDSRVKLGSNWVFTGQVAESQMLLAVNPKQVWGTAAFGELRHAGRNFNSSTVYVDRSADFAGNDLGFFQRTGIRQARQTLNYQVRPEGTVLTSAGPDFFANYTTDQFGRVQDWLADMPLAFKFKGPVSFSVGRTESYERYLGIGFRKNSDYASFSSDKLKVLGLRASFSQGKEINFFPAAGVLPALGNDTEASAGLSFKPGARFQLDETYIYSRLGNQFARGVLFENHLMRTKVNFQFSRPLSFRAIVDYNSLAGNPLLVNLEHTKRMNYDLLFTYLVHPGTALYVGYSDRYENLVIDPGDPLGVHRAPGINHPTARQLFVKLSYAFRL
jgi:hypothetical protein